MRCSKRSYTLQKILTLDPKPKSNKKIKELKLSKFLYYCFGGQSHRWLKETSYCCNTAMLIFTISSQHTAYYHQSSTTESFYLSTHLFEVENYWLPGELAQTRVQTKIGKTYGSFSVNCQRQIYCNFIEIRLIISSPV